MKEVAHYSWGERPYDHLGRLICSYFKANDFSVRVLETWAILVARHGLAAVIFPRPTGRWKQKEQAQQDAFARDWQGHIFTVGTQDECERAARTIDLMQRALNSVRPEQIANGIRKASSRAA